MLEAAVENRERLEEGRERGDRGCVRFSCASRRSERRGEWERPALEVPAGDAVFGKRGGARDSPRFRSVLFILAFWCWAPTCSCL